MRTVLSLLLPAACACLVVSVQTVEALNGARLAVVVMKPGRSQGLGCGSDLMGGTYRCPRSNDAYVLLNPTTHARKRARRTAGFASSPASTG